MITKCVYDFSQKNKPVEKVNTGMSVTFKTQDCFSNQIQSDDQLVTSVGFNFNTMNPAAGPVFIEEAEPGDVLVVDIEAIEVADHGVVATIPGVGPLCDKSEIRSKVVQIREGKAFFNDIEFEINPMIGVIGVAPEEGVAVGCGFPGAHGGNMDCNKIVAGSRLYFPVKAPGALFQMGDLHAVMGDGELCGTGIEIAAEVTAKFDVIKNFNLNWPVLETEDKWYVIASAQEYSETLKYASEEMQKLLVNAYQWDETDTYLYLSLRGDVEICQGCKPCDIEMVVRLGIPKIAGKAGLITTP